ncbi:hypothetical protein [Dyella nitratireducens]|uniref:Uncharacterized protein n=1 Tax=Dyella nitratireducens TaxID=1849580 RepID=A0ABQ1FMQ1_9GAMM|nr:hypothetical protein [Dyella nitratireducens]GGA20605.1 hypothetical protein GCM10010981_05860 [Dyella nitratireducens]GLQ44352.1 hypothetical protein GCM10007902_42020 [Dyella nitratireducens]
MKRRVIAALTIALLTTAAWAQTGNQPLNLKLPSGGYQGYPASGSTAAQPASSSTSANNKGGVTVNGHPAATSPAPGVYYGDTSGVRGNHDAAVPVCDDSTYNKAQVHGSVGMGVVSGSHIGTGSYQSGAVSVVQNTGSCDHPTGSVGISIGVSRMGGFNGH